MATSGFEIVERFVRSKAGGNDGGDDGILVLEDAVLLADGTSARGDRRVEGRSPGRFAVDTITQALGRRLGAEADLRAVADRLTERLGRSLEAVGATDETRAAYVLVAYVAPRQEIWRVGDARFLIDGRGHPPEMPVDAVAAAARALLLRCHLMAGAALEDLMIEDPGRAMIAPLLDLQHVLRNLDVEDGYGAIDGRPVPERFLEVVPVPAATREIVLASDGYPVLKRSLAASEAALSELLADDPLCMERFPQTKGLQPGQVSFDDRSYVRLRLAPGGTGPGLSG